MAGGQGTNSNFTVFWVLRCQNRRGKSSVYQNDDQQRKFEAKPDLFNTRSVNYYNYNLLSVCSHCICAKCQGRTLKVYVEDKCCVKYQTAHFKACD